MLRKVMFAIVVGLVGLGDSYGQEFPMPGREHERLKKELVGTWDAVMEMNGQKSNCAATYTSICNGMWISSDFHGDLGGMKFEGHGLDGYDQKKKKYVGVWVDSIETAPMHFEGDYNPTTKTLEMTGESMGADGKMQKYKNVTITKDDDHFTFKMYMVQPDGTEQLAFTIEYARRK